MPMPYRVIKNNNNFQVQGTSNGKLVNGKDMSYDSYGEAWAKVAELIKADYEKRVSKELRIEIAKQVVEDYNKQGDKK